MALKLRKDIKKSSYYVWFLGAKESKGLRGSEYILPVIKHLEEREKDIEPFKVTLQVSHKGLKIIQNVIGGNINNNGSSNNNKQKTKNETIKHFIPHNTISCVYQHDDVIACILLLFNPVTKCPLHVHAYRCDSLETATLLKQQLQTLIERPENQKKFAEIESRLSKTSHQSGCHSQSQQQQQHQQHQQQNYSNHSKNNSVVGGGSSHKSHNHSGSNKVESSLGSDTGTSTRESESSEERFAVENTRVSTLYDSVAAELREKLAKNNVPILLPPRDYDTVHRQKGNLTGIELRRCLNANIVGHQNQNQKGRRLESSGGSSGIGSDHPPSPDSPDAPDTRFNTLDNQSTSDEDWNGDTAESTLYLMHAAPPQVTLPRHSTREKSPERYARYSPEKQKQQGVGREISKYLEKPIGAKYVEKSLERHQQHQKKKSQHVQQHRYYEEGIEYHQEDNFRQQQHQSKEKPVKYFEDDGFDETLRYRNRSSDRDRAPRYDFDPSDDPTFYKPKHQYPNNIPVPKTRKTYPSPSQFYEPPASSPRPKSLQHQYRQRSPSPDNTSPRDRFKDAKEKFLSMEKERIDLHASRSSRHCEPPISPTISKEKTPGNSFLKRHESMMMYERPKPAPRNLHSSEEVRYRRSEVPLERYRNEKYDQKRRSMFSLIEEEHRKNSNEIARELKRRSYMENESDLADSENFSKSAIDLDHVGEMMKFGSKGGKNAAGYRHSYAEPMTKLREGKGGGKRGNEGSKQMEMLHRTNSVSNSNGRVGIASVHPY